MYIARLIFSYTTFFYKKYIVKFAGVLNNRPYALDFFYHYMIK